MSPLPAGRFAGLGRSPTIALHDTVRRLREQGHRVLDLAGGQPDFATPEHICAAARAALHAGHTHYTPSRGIPELRRAISRKLFADNGITVPADTGVIVTPSAKHALHVCLLAVLDPGDEILVPSPGWVSYAPMARLAGATSVPIGLSIADDYRLSADALERAVTPRTRAVLVNTPNNPTGRMLSHAEATEVAGFAAAHDLVIITDEIYERIAFSAEHVSIAALPAAAERTLTVNGFSKGYAMTGWRLGYLAGPHSLVAAALQAQEHTVSCATSFVQHAGVAALEGSAEPVEEMVRAYARRRTALVAALDGLPGVRCPAPEGTFYAFPTIDADLHGSDVDFAGWLLEHAGVAVVPGSAFGPGGEGHVRLSFATGDAVLAEAAHRIAEAVRTR